MGGASIVFLGAKNDALSYKKPAFDHLIDYFDSLSFLDQCMSPIYIEQFNFNFNFCLLCLKCFLMKNHFPYRF